MADLLQGVVLTDNYADCQLGPFPTARNFIYSVFQDPADLGGIAAMQCAIGIKHTPWGVHWEDFDRRQLPVSGAIVSNVQGVRFKRYPGNTHTVRVDLELDTNEDPIIPPTNTPAGTLTAGGAFSPFKPGGGGGGAATLKAEADSWYGCGDNSQANNSVVKNY